MENVVNLIWNYVFILICTLFIHIHRQNEMRIVYETWRGNIHGWVMQAGTSRAWSWSCWRWFSSYSTTKNTRNWWDIEAASLHNALTVYGVVPMSNSFFLDLDLSISHSNADSGLVHLPKAGIHYLLATYWLIQTRSPYICPSKLPSHLISIII